MAADHKATLRDYVDLFDAAAQRIQDNTTRTKLDDGSHEWRHTRITGQSVSRLADSPSVYHSTDSSVPGEFMWQMLVRLVQVIYNKN